MGFSSRTLLQATCLNIANVSVSAVYKTLIVTSTRMEFWPKKI